MKYIYFFDEGSFASLYGIGTYREQWGQCLKGQSDFSLNVVILHSDKEEFVVEEADGIRTFYFPLVRRSFLEKMSLYMRNVWYLLSPYIQVGTSDGLIFHLNYHGEYPFIDWMRRDFPSCRIVFTVHFLKWYPLLKGNLELFKSVVEKGGGKTEEEKQVYDLYREEVLLYGQV